MESKQQKNPVSQRGPCTRKTRSLEQCFGGSVPLLGSFVNDRTYSESQGPVCRKHKLLREVALHPGLGGHRKGKGCPWGRGGSGGMSFLLSWGKSWSPWGISHYRYGNRAMKKIRLVQKI